MPDIRGDADEGRPPRRAARNTPICCWLALRQSIAGHKAAVDPEGKLLFVSKECFSNGCAATVDVSYPSIPLFLLYNTELVKGMMRPIFRYAAQARWPFDFAPTMWAPIPSSTGRYTAGGRIPADRCRWRSAATCW